MYTIEPDLNDLGASIETHNMKPDKVLSLAKSMGAPLNGILIVGCEPSPIELGPEEGHMGLSDIPSTRGVGILLGIPEGHCCCHAYSRFEVPLDFARRRTS